MKETELAADFAAALGKYYDISERQSSDDGLCVALRRKDKGEASSKKNSA